MIIWTSHLSNSSFLKLLLFDESMSRDVFGRTATVAYGEIFFCGSFALIDRFFSPFV